MKAVLFDLFETLVTEQYADRPTEQAVADTLGLDLEDMRAWWKKTSRDRMIGAFATCQETLAALYRALGVAAARATIQASCRERLKRKRSYLLGVAPELLEMLARLRASGWTIGLVSNATPDEVASWPECPLRDAVDDAVFSCQVGCMKPDPEIYHLACARLGIAPTKAVFVGDGKFAELQGAAAVGMRPVQARWYCAHQLAWNASAELSRIDNMDELFHELERMVS